MWYLPTGGAGVEVVERVEGWVMSTQKIEYRGRDLLKERMQELSRHYGSMRNAGKELGVSAAFLSMVYRGKKSPPDWLLCKLGLARILSIVDDTVETRTKIVP